MNYIYTLIEMECYGNSNTCCICMVEIRHYLETGFWGVHWLHFCVHFLFVIWNTLVVIRQEKIHFLVCSRVVGTMYTVCTVYSKAYILHYDIRNWLVNHPWPYVPAFLAYSLEYFLDLNILLTKIFYDKHIFSKL